MKETLARVSATDAVKTLCYDLLEETGVDWYNNEGGFGDIYIDLDPLSIKIDMNTRYIQTHADCFELEEGDL